MTLDAQEFFSGSYETSKYKTELHLISRLQSGFRLSTAVAILLVASTGSSYSQENPTLGTPSNIGKSADTNADEKLSNPFAVEPKKEEPLPSLIELGKEAKKNSVLLREDTARKQKRREKLQAANQKAEEILARDSKPTNPFAVGEKSEEPLPTLSELADEAELEATEAKNRADDATQRAEKSSQENEAAKAMLKVVQGAIVKDTVNEKHENPFAVQPKKGEPLPTLAELGEDAEKGKDKSKVELESTKKRLADLDAMDAKIDELLAEDSKPTNPFAFEDKNEETLPSLAELAEEAKIKSEKAKQKAEENEDKLEAAKQFLELLKED